MAMRLVGIDIGATSLKAGLFDETGRERYLVRVATGDALRDPEQLVATLAETTRRVVAEAPPAFDPATGTMADDPGPGPVEDRPHAVGLGVAGVIDQATGVVRQSPQFPEWRDFPLRERLQAALGVPVGLDNDANTMAWGELWAGAARGLDSFLYVTIGSGLGGAWAVGGRVASGERGMAGEFGHICVDARGGRRCGCGAIGCLEAYVSQVGLRRTLEDWPDRAFQARFADLPWRAWPERLGELDEHGDPQARAILDDWGFRLGVAFGGLVNAFDIATLVVGGGVGRMLPRFHDAWMTHLKAHSFAAIHEKVQIVPSALDDLAGRVGGARLALLALDAAPNAVSGLTPKAAIAPTGGHHGP